jgi:hypothetical protein
MALRDRLSAQYVVYAPVAGPTSLMMGDDVLDPLERGERFADPEAAKSRQFALAREQRRRVELYRKPRLGKLEWLSTVDGTRLAPEPDVDPSVSSSVGPSLAPSRAAPALVPLETPAPTTPGPETGPKPDLEL